MARLAGRYVSQSLRSSQSFSTLNRDSSSRHKDPLNPANLCLGTIEWEPRPTSPSSIRLIHFGRMLDDKSPLKGKHNTSRSLGVACPIAGQSSPIGWIEPRRECKARPGSSS